MLKNNTLYIFLFISRLTNRLGLGKTIRIKKLHGGMENRSYEVWVSRGRRYVVRILGNSDEARLRNEIHIQQAALRANMPISHMIELQKDDYTYTDAGLTATVSEWIYGKHLKTPLSTEQSYAVGKLLGKFHANVKSDDVITNRYLFVGRERIEARVLAMKNENIRTKVMHLLERTRLPSLAKLPSGVLHGDLHIKNIMATDNGLYALDMQSGGFGPYILDIGRSMADVCSRDGQFDTRLARAFIQGYQSERELTPEERKLVLRSVIFGAVCVIVWGYQHQKDQIAEMFTSIALTAERCSNADII